MVKFVYNRGIIKGDTMYTAPEEQKIANVRNLDEKLSLQQQNALLRNNVKELQGQLNAAHIRIKELGVYIGKYKYNAGIAPDSATEEELIRRVMVARGVNPDDINEVEQFWSDYHGIS